MASYRLAGIPMDHVQAEVAAFPFASVAALSLRGITLDPQLDPSTASLWRRAECELLSRFPAFSLDELVAIRDRFWFSTAGPVPLHRYVRQLAHTFLEPHGGRAVPCLRDQDALSGVDRLARAAAARRAWLWLNLALPTDLLLSALGSAATLELLSPSLELDLCENAFAETHLHLGAALDFAQLWSVAMRTIADTRLTANAFKAPGAELNEGRELAPWMLRAALARYVLAGFLRRLDPAMTFGAWLHSRGLQDVHRLAGAGGAAMLQMALTDLTQGSLTCPGSFGLLQRLYARIGGVTTHGGLFSREESLEADPVGQLLPGDQGTARSAEMRLMGEAFRYLHGRTDDGFALLFWQGVRVRALFFRHVVQRPMTPGLQWFVRFYGRSGPARRPLEVEAQLESAAFVCGVDRGLKSLEFRTAPGRNLSELFEYTSRVDEFVRQRLLPSGASLDPALLPGRQSGFGRRLDRFLRQRQRRAGGHWEAAGYHRGLGSSPAPFARATPEVGLVLHFIKERGGGANQGRPGAHWRGTHADPRCRNSRGANRIGYRYATFFKQKRMEAMAIEKLLRHFPLALETIRGLDVCTDELAVPTWVFVPIFARVRAAAGEATTALRRWLGREVPTVRTTVHAGEDFVHLLTGLRCVDEAVEQLDLREGDRIGHGLALGMDPRDWAARAGRLPVIAEERLFDLVWEWGFYGRQLCRPVPGRSEHIEREIAVLSERICGQIQPPRQLEQLREDLCEPFRLSAVGFPDGTKPRHARHPALRFLQDHLTNPGWFERGRQILWIDPAGEAETLAALQACLRHKIGSRGLAVEVNPTSNLLVGDLSDLTTHPMWRLRPPRGNGDAPPVSVCIGSDDPLVFASNLRQEYQLLHDAMTLAGLSDEEARLWLDRSRRCGLESRFTLTWRDRRPLKSVLGISPSPGRPLLL